MALYFLSYDLRKARDYEKLYEQLDDFSAVQVLESVWCFKRFNTSASALRDYFEGYIDKDDGLCVVEVGSNNWATYNTNGTPANLE